MSEEKTTKYSVLTKFRDKDSKKIHLPGTEIEITEKRANEIATKLGAGFIIKKDEEVNPDDEFNAELNVTYDQDNQVIEESEIVNFDEMKVKELNDYAAENGIEIPGDVTLKPDLIAFLKEATKTTLEEK